MLFAIDISDSMLAARPSESGKGEPQSPAKAAIKCAYHLMQQRIISNPKDMMGVLFFGTEASKFYDEDEGSRGGLSYPHCYLFTDLDVPDANDVKSLRALAEDEEEENEILVPSRERVSMANVLFCANQIFTSKASNFLSRRLFIITDSDNPHAEDRTMRSAATVRAKDLYDLGVIIELFPISKPDHEFDRSKFYDVSCPISPRKQHPAANEQRTLFTKLHLETPKRLRLLPPVPKSPMQAVMVSRCSIPFCHPSTRDQFHAELCSRFRLSLVQISRYLLLGI